MSKLNVTVDNFKQHATFRCIYKQMICKPRKLQLHKFNQWGLMIYYWFIYILMINSLWKYTLFSPFINPWLTFYYINTVSLHKVLHSAEQEWHNGTLTPTGGSIIHNSNTVSTVVIYWTFYILQWNQNQALFLLDKFPRFSPFPSVW